MLINREFLKKVQILRLYMFPTDDSFSPDSGSLKEYDVICMNPDGFAIHCNITLSYGIISPDTINSKSAFYVFPSGDVGIGVGSVYDSYGIKHRRSRILSTVRCLWYRMVVSATTITATMSRIPTDYSKSTLISRVDYTSYILLPDGSSDDYHVYQVYSSYGIT